MSEMDKAVERLARRAAVMNLALGHDGPAGGLPGLVNPVLQAAQEVLRLAQDHATYSGVNRPLPNPVEDVFADFAQGRVIDPKDMDDFHDFVYGRGRWAEKGDAEDDERS